LGFWRSISPAAKLAVLGTALAIKMIAYVGVAPIAAAFAQWLPRRAMLASLDLVRAAVAVLLPFVTEVWQVYVLIFLLQSASAAFTPTFQATIPDILPDEKEYTRALPSRGSPPIWKASSALCSPRPCSRS
jgi:MFS family permease